VKRSEVISFGAGLVFALGLGLAGMTQPSKVLAFLDVSGAWDPALAFVMIGAIGVHASLLWLGRRRAKPALAPVFEARSRQGVDARLVVGAALFGVGWGASGFCPGPALVSLMSFSPPVWLFVAAMAAGMAALWPFLLRRAARP
jgi:uncharacterized protein